LVPARHGRGKLVASLEWALAHLVDKPEVQEKVHREVDAEAAVSLSLGGAAMPYLHAIVLETLRMHPPLPVIPRHVQANTAAGVLGGTAVPPGDLYVNFAVADMGRDNKTWTNPDKFQPGPALTHGRHGQPPRAQAWRGPRTGLFLCYGLKKFNTQNY
jgi:cytochrome P450